MKALAVALLAACALADVAAGEPVEPVRLTLIRHAESAGDPFATPERPVKGFLTEPRGVAQARATAEALEGMRFDVAFSSPYGRALQTAEIVMGQRQTEIKVLPFLREWIPNPALRDAPSAVFEEIRRRDALRAAQPRPEAPPLRLKRVHQLVPELAEAARRLELKVWPGRR